MRSLIIVIAACTTVHAAPADRCSDGRPFDTKALRDDIAYLASPDLDGRAPGSDGDRAARAYIAARFACLGLSTTEQKVGDSTNLIALVPGENPEQIVVIGAHHDHLGKRHLGANDNASGVVALLAIAKAVAQRDAKPQRSIAFVAFADEERGEVGSEYFVAHPPDEIPLAHVVEYINLDMVGSYSSRGWVAAMGAFKKLPARTIIDAIAHPKLDVAVGGRAERSDHEAFCKAGIPYVFFWTPDDRCYHATCDTVERIDFPHMAQIAALASDLAQRLADTRLDLAASREKLGCFAR